MEDLKLGLMSSIISYLRNEFRAGYLDSENAEGLEVAIHCLENIFDVNKAHRPQPFLLDVYQQFLFTSVLGFRDATDEEKAMGERLKVEGNTAMSAGKYIEALDYYSRAIEEYPKNAVYYCNRAAARSKLNDHVSAVNDCKLAIELDPNYSKAYGRLGLAYCGLESYINALENYKKAYDLEPDNEGYRRNFMLAQSKVADLCCCTLEERSHSSTSMQNTEINQGNTATTATTTDTIYQQTVPGVDVNALLANPALVHIASQMLGDPSMQNVMSSILAQRDSANAMQALLQVGQNLARQMQQDNPSLLAQIRHTFSAEALATPPTDECSVPAPTRGHKRGGPSGDKKK